ncbi:MAG: SusD/RagB family nutrient-binding outer membrane lipoprotein, partial [Polaribacter sp.]
MKKYIQYSLVILSVLVFSSCTNIEALQNDPNRTTEVTPDLILTKLCIKAFKNVSLNATITSRELVNLDSNNDYQYYTWNRNSFDDYSNLREVGLMKKEARRTNQNEYLYLADFFEAYFIVKTTRIFGDIPYSEALKLTKGISRPKYDTQKQIFITVLDKLKKASLTLPSSGVKFNGDIIYEGNPLKWKKLINSFYLKVLMELSKHTNDTDLDIKNKFREVISNPAKFPLVENNQDSGQLKFLDIANNRFPLFNNNNLQTTFTMEKTFVDKMKRLKDPRLFEIAQKTPSGAGLNRDDFNAYDGVLGSGLLSDNQTESVNGNSSKINKDYYSNPINKSSFIISYAELNFILSEAIVRGWITGNAEQYYKKGIKSSFEYFGILPKLANYVS